MKDYWSLVILVILLLALVFVAVYQYYLDNYSFYADDLEGFIAFQKNTQPLDLVTIPQYHASSRLYKLYDSIYYDNRNGNIIEVVGEAYDASNNNVSTNPRSIDSLIITHRDKSMGNDIAGDNAQAPNSEGLVNDFPNQSLFSQWIKPTTQSNTGKYSILYIAWNKNTFIDIIDYSTVNSDGKPIPRYVLGAFFGKDDPALQSIAKPLPTSTTMEWRDTIPNSIQLAVSPTPYSMKREDLSYTHLPIANYSTKKGLFRITSFLHYDTENGNLVLAYNDRSVDAYSRNGMTKLANMENLDTTITNVSYQAFTLQMNPDKPAAEGTPLEPIYFIYYIAFEQNTIVAVLQKEESAVFNLKLLTVARFDTTGYIAPTRGQETNGDYKPKDGDTIHHYNLDNLFSEWFKGYHKTEEKEVLSNGMDANSLVRAFMLREEMKYLNDNYIPKSQLVPPVFPVIQSCPACTDGKCSKHGDYYDSSNNRHPFEQKEATKESPKESDMKIFSDLAKSAGSGVVGLTKDVVGGTLDLTKQAVGGTVDLTKQAVGGTVDLTKQAVGGTVDLTKQAVGGTVDLTKQAVGGIGSIGGIGGGSSTLSTSSMSSNVNANTNGGQAQAITYGNMQTSPYGQNYPPYGLPSAMPAPVQYNLGGIQPGIDGYSYYGASRNMGTSDFQPRPESFASFGK